LPEYIFLQPLKGAYAKGVSVSIISKKDNFYLAMSETLCLSVEQPLVDESSTPFDGAIINVHYQLCLAGNLSLAKCNESVWKMYFDFFFTEFTSSIA
jgi:hypothetical protein